ncbi:MAG: adenylate/guanylate cyclase domain-containing protein [Nostocaceae cyanobacterium]|nr:adenylate/guanylate cyclase domain-containing protein [Nostocaceae cyanobacterium]
MNWNLVDFTNAQENQLCNLTVMFCDLVGSTALSEQLSPCTYWKLLRTYQKLCTYAIQDYSGYIAQYLGDGLLVYFGYPSASKDAAKRAVQAGLDILVGMEQLNLILKKEIDIQNNLAVRMGIATGEVAIGQVQTGNKSECLAIGVIPNIAARLQNLATSNSIVFCPATYEIVGECFDCQSLGKKNLKGISQPVDVYQVANYNFS